MTQRPSDMQLAGLEKLLGAARTTTDATSLAAYEIDGVRPAAVVRAANAGEAAEIVRLAASEQLALIPCSGRSKLAIGGMPARYDVALDFSGCNRIVSYDPGDLTLSVEPGVRLEDLQRALGEHGQFLPLEVAFSDRATVGGAIATNAYSPLRAHFGSARDFVLGMEFVTGLGEIAKSGGRVVKNVTGYDLHKLLIGSLGTLAVITRLHFRTFPRPAELRVFNVAFATPRDAHEFVRAIVASPLEPHVLEIMNPTAAHVSGLAARAPADAGAWRVVAAAAGSAAVVGRHARDLERMAQKTHATQFEACGGADAEKCLRAVREFVPLALAHGADATMIRVALVPTSAAALAERLATIADRYDLDAALALGSAGVGYVALLSRTTHTTRDAVSDQSAKSDSRGPVGTNFIAAIKSVLEAAGSDAGPARGFIEWCPTELKRGISLWGEPREDFVMMRRVKNIFDPHGILALGRFCGGI